MPESALRFGSTLDAYSAAVRDEIAGYLASGEPDRFLYGPIRACTLGPGKCLRPALCIAACEAFGGSQGDAMASAVAVELLHAAFLIHDDIEDGSVRRRGRSALHVELGTAIALNAGDALAVLAQRPLLDNVERLGSRMARTVLTEFQVAMERTVEGQAVELGWRHDQAMELTPGDYLDMILHKTCAYTTILPLRVGAMIGSWGDADLDAISRFGFALGAAFQIRDDVLDLVSADATYGKNVLGDIWEGKRTLALIHLLRVASQEDRATVSGFLARPAGDRSGDAAGRILELMNRYGSVAFAADFGARMADEALDAFDDAFSTCPPSPALDFLRGIVPFMIARAS
jgi:geranylgeranyl diphosphate synthase, type II